MTVTLGSKLVTASNMVSAHVVTRLLQSGHTAKPLRATTRRNTVARKLSIIWPLRLWTATPCGRIERSNACSTKRLKTATIHKRVNYYRDSPRSSHCAFFGVVVVSHACRTRAGRPIARCIDGP